MPRLQIALSILIAPALLSACIITTDDADDDANADATTNAAMDASGDTSEADDTTGDAADDTAGETGEGTADGTGDTGDPGSANDRCPTFCADIVAAGCESGPTMEGCLLTCEALTSAPVCDPTAHAYFDCVDGAEITCNGLGEPVAGVCGLSYLAAIECAVTEDPNPDIVEPCAAHCDAVAAADCDLSQSVEDCNTDCQWLGAEGVGCDEALGEYLECVTEAEITCIVGYAVPQGCGQQWQGYWDCVDAAAAGG